MKKILFLSLLLGFVSFACNDNEDTHVNIMVPNGSPAISQMAFEYETPEIENLTYTIDRVSGPDNLVAAFGSESHEIIFAPTNLGARLISTGVPYKFAATINWGNFHLASQSSLNSLDDLDGKEIILFGQNTTPDIILTTILDHHPFEEDPTMVYVDSVQTANTYLMEDHSRIALLAEPVLSVASRQIDALNIIDLQQEWKQITGDEAYPQAGIFVHESIPSDLVDAYLEEIKTAMVKLHEDTQKITAYGEALDYPFPSAVIEAAIPRSNINFMSALDSKDALEFYFERILALNAELLNNEMPDEDFYR